MRKLIKKQGGFTLLELLIVIVIIGILAVLIIPNLASGPQRARDSQRKSDLRNIKTALETFYNDTNNYPTASGWKTSLVPSSNPYIKVIPTDPKSKGDYAYAATPSGCDNSATACTGYTLTATLENTKDSQINSGTTGYQVTSAN